MRDVFDVFDPNKAGEYFIDMHRAGAETIEAGNTLEGYLVLYDEMQTELVDMEYELEYAQDTIQRLRDDSEELLELVDEYWTIKGALWNLWDTLVEHFLMWRAK